MKYPIKLDDSYTCQGIDADGETVIFNDLLSEGDGVGPWDEEQEAAVFMDAIVVRRDDGLWVVADERRKGAVVMTAEDRPWERGPDGQAITFPNGQHDFLLSALRAIAGPSDSGPFIEVYRAAGGGYEGLQAIARAALAADERRKGSRP